MVNDAITIDVALDCSRTQGVTTSATPLHGLRAIANEQDSDEPVVPSFSINFSYSPRHPIWDLTDLNLAGLSTSFVPVDVMMETLPGSESYGAFIQSIAYSWYRH